RLLLCPRPPGVGPRISPPRAGRKGPPAAAAPGIGASGSGRAASAFVIPSAYLPKSEVAFIPSTSALVTSVDGRVGDLVGGSTVLTLATGNPYVTADLTA